jgi:hypothetical protein
MALPMTIKERAFVNLRPLLGNFNWAEFLFLIGGAQAGKSYAVTDFFVSQFMTKGTVFYWIRLTDTQARKLLQNNAEKLVDPDIRRRRNLDLITNGNAVYCVTKRSKPDKNGKTKIVEKKLMARVLSLSTFYTDKGQGYFDKDYKGWYNIGMDEFQPEKGERRTFDIVYAFVRQMENLVRNTKSHVRLIGMCNLLEEASDLLCCFNFLPEKFGTYKLKSKRCVINYIKPTQAYKEMRKGSIADILLPNASMYSNIQNTDYTLINKKRLNKPIYIIKFSDEKMYTVWDNNVIKEYNKEKVQVIPMLPYLNELYNINNVKMIIDNFNCRVYTFHTLICFKRFQSDLQLIKSR